ncbi:MAG: DUF5654 family protein [Patescibacteria group bacterium]
MKEEVIKKIAKVNRDIQRQTFGYILTALGLVVGLAWNDAIRSSIEYLFPLNQNSITAKFLYAIILTMLIVFISKYVLKTLETKEIEK